MARTAEGQAKLDKMLASGMGRQQALKLLINAQKKAASTPAAAPSPAVAPVPPPASLPGSTFDDERGGFTPAPSEEGTSIIAGQPAMPAEQRAAEQIPGEPIPAETGNPAVDQANILASILNSPLYTESIKSAYLTQYLPGLTQANYEINRARAQEVQNSFLRQQAQAQAIREIAGSYAARGLRTPKMVTEGFAPVQQATELERSAAQQAINDLVANKEILYGAGAQNAETFITDPNMFGSVGAGARRSALGELTQLPQSYGLTQIANASRSPFGGGQQPGGATSQQGFERPAPVTGDEAMNRPAPVTGDEGMIKPAPTQTAAQIQARIDAANRYIRQQQAKNNARTVAGAQQKLAGYQAELKKVRGY